MSQNIGPQNLYCPVLQQGVDGLALWFRFDQQLMGKVNALPHLGDLHCGVRCRMIRH